MNEDIIKMQNELATLQAELKNVQRERDIANLTAQYTKLGYGDLAEATAIAHADMDTKTLFENQQKVLNQAGNGAIDTATIPEKKANETDPFEDFIKGFVRF